MYTTCISKKYKTSKIQELKNPRKCNTIHVL